MRSVRALARPAAQALALPAAASSSSSASMPILRRGIASSSSRAAGAAALATGRQSSLSSLAPRQASFSTSTRVATEAEKKQKTEEVKEAQEKAVGESMGATAESSSTADSKALEELQAAVKEKDAKIKDLTDAVLYGKADLQNAQRRAKDEKAQASEFAITKFARDLTSSLDILALALRSVPEPLRTAPSDAVALDDPRKAVAELYSGVELTSKSIMDMLKQHGVTSFDPTGEKFNPQEHEAMFQAPVPGKEPGTVLECSKVGFKIKDRVLRAAQVGVVQESA